MARRRGGGILAWVLVAGLSSLGGCTDTTQPRPPVQAKAGKRALYGDAGLMPTREGERVRRELALAEEIAAAVERLGAPSSYVDVELGEHGRASVVVIADSPDSAVADPPLAPAITQLAAAIVPTAQPETIQVWLRPGPAVASSPSPRLAGAHGVLVALAALGLGLSLGITAERVRARRR